MEKNNDLMSGKGEKGEWKTINGTHIYIEDGQSVEDAMNKQFKKSSDTSEKKKSFSSKQELIDFVKHQTNIELKDDKSERFNDNEEILYARIPGKTGYQHKATNPVLSLLSKNGIRFEEHLNGGYWIYLNND